MKGLLYPRLALTNIRKNGKLYGPYLFAAVTTIAMFYDMYSISFNGGLKELPGASDLTMVMTLACVVTGVFSAIFLLYTNSFLIKRRKKELGLYNILGMEKRHIAKIMFYETLFISAFSVVLGCGFGMVFDKLLSLLLFKLLRFDVKLGFSISVSGLAITAALFFGIFFVTLIYNIARVRISKPVELMQGGSVGEREPKTKWLMVVLGLLSLGTAYYIALTTDSPIDAIVLFFFAVLLVILGTYFLFIAGSIALMKLLRKNKKYYYNTKHFNSVSGMIYRMKQNAVGLANICILSTMVLVMISTSVCMYVGTDDALVKRFPYDISMTGKYTPATPDFDELLKKASRDSAEQCGRKVLDETMFDYLAFATIRDGDNLTSNDTNYSSSASVHEVCLITAEEYNRLTGSSVSLKDDEVIIYSSAEELPDKFSVLGYELNIVDRLDSFPSVGEFTAFVINMQYMVVADNEVLFDFYDKQLAEYGANASTLRKDYSFNIDGTDEQKSECYAVFDEAANTALRDMNESIDESDRVFYSSDCRQEAKASFYALYGTFLFLGIFLGTLFLMVTVLIMYYKQVSEGYDDKERFEIMQKVGMSTQEVKKSIRSQVLTVFFLPLAASVIHLAFGFKVITKLMALMNLTNVPLFLICTVISVIVFALFYALVYALTARTYYKIVER